MHIPTRTFQALHLKAKALFNVDEMRSSGRRPSTAIALDSLANPRFDARLSRRAIAAGMANVQPQAAMEKDASWSCGPNSVCRAAAMLGLPVDHSLAVKFVRESPRAFAHVDIGPRPKDLASHARRFFSAAPAEAQDNDNTRDAQNWVTFVEKARRELQCQRPVTLLWAISNTQMHWINIVASQGTDQVVILDTNGGLYEFVWEDLHHLADKKGTHLSNIGVLSSYNWLVYNTNQTFMDRTLGVDSTLSYDFYKTVHHIEDIAHFYKHGQAEGRVASPWCHPGWYREQHREQYPNAASIDPHHTVEHMLTVGLTEGRPLSPHFNPKAYLALHADLSALYVDEECRRDWELYSALLTHYIRHGLDEGRTADHRLCFKAYLLRYNDLKAAFGPTAYRRAAAHWYEYGINEERSSAR